METQEPPHGIGALRDAELREIAAKPSSEALDSLLQASRQLRLPVDVDCEMDEMIRAGATAAEVVTRVVSALQHRQ